MFTGIVREVGSVVGFTGGRLVVEAPATAADVQLGDSVAVSGACLTIVERVAGRLAFDVVPETFARTSFGQLRTGARVNLEPALRAADRLGGHVVQGHVDGVGRVRSLVAEGDGARLGLDLPAALARYCVEKGSIALEGVSLTVARLDEAGLEIALVPHTLAATTLGDLAPADPVNVEVDLLAKYVERLLATRIER